MKSLSVYYKVHSHTVLNDKLRSNVREFIKCLPEDTYISYDTENGYHVELLILKPEK